MQDFTQLEIWRRARKLSMEIYNVTKGYPITEQYGLTSQTRRAAVSIAANIAEGSGRGSRADFSRILQIAAGEVSELQSHLILDHDLSFISMNIKTQLLRESTEIRKMIAGFAKALKTYSEDDKLEREIKQVYHRVMNN